MRNLLTIAAAGAFLSVAACGGGGNSGGANGTTGAATGGSTGGTTGGGSSTGAPLAAGASCSANAQCASAVCGIDATAGGTGNCCTAQCVTSDGGCGATGCDDTGSCQYPTAGTSCGTGFCGAGNKLTQESCNGLGACIAGSAMACAHNFACTSDGTGCNSTCAKSKDCASGYVCNGAGCVAPAVVGSCTENDDCYSGICGINGTGHCCVGDAGCLTGDSTCGATDCEPQNGSCNYPDAGTSCGSVVANCTDGVQQNPSVCDGKGTCPAPKTADCTPFICGPTACLKSCTDDSSCGSSDFCDLTNSICCGSLASGASITVDATGGNDATTCCSIGGNAPCQTLVRAMTLIDNAKAQNVTINARVENGSTWNPPGEVYPIVLGWGAEVSAPGVFFYDPNDGGSEVIAIDHFSANDTVGYASLVGAHGNVVTVGPDEFKDVSLEASMIQVQPGSTLYIANAAVNGSYEYTIGLNDQVYTETTAISVAAGAAMVVGQDKLAHVTGTVTIGNALDDDSTNGWSGIVCGTANGKGCTITDAPLQAGASSLVILGQENVDIDAEDYAKITLTSNPVIGLTPADAGFQQCPDKPDAEQAPNFSGNNTAAVLLNGQVTMTFNNGTVQCISGDAFQLNASPNGNGNPTLTLDATTIQNTDYGVDAFAGSATISNSTIQYNANGVKQGTDGTNVSTLNLSSGGDGGSTTVVCSNSFEGSNENGGLPGVSVLNNTSGVLNAQNVIWDTTGPDLFSCNSDLSNCTCKISSCTADVNDAGYDGLDAVYTSTGTVQTSGNGLSTLDCTAPAGGGQCGMTICPPLFMCCGPNACCGP